MRSISILAVLAAATALAGSRSENITYVQGNLTGLSTQSPGKVEFGEGKNLEIKSGLATVAVPYSSITKAELGLTAKPGASAPAYKIWRLPKRMLTMEIQEVQWEFKDEDGSARQAMLTLDRVSAQDLVSHIRLHGAPLAKKNDPKVWWGDNVWKTQSNAAQWPKSPDQSAKAQQ